MKITYIHHSAFLAETEHACLLFDYFKGSLPKLPEGKRLYIFASHRHPDHFSKVIFDIAAEHGDTVLLLSSDIWRKRVPEELLERTVFMGAGEMRLLPLPSVPEGIKIETFRSTDEGVAFLIGAEGRTLYHAGDLNHWFWEGEPEEWNRKMGEAYRLELKKWRERHIDVAFMLLDPRQEKHFWLGMDDFMRMVGADVVFPMHFWEDFQAAARFKAWPAPTGTGTGYRRYTDGERNSWCGQADGGRRAFRSAPDMDL